MENGNGRLPLKCLKMAVLCKYCDGSEQPSLTLTLLHGLWFIMRHHTCLTPATVLSHIYCTGRGERTVHNPRQRFLWLRYWNSRVLRQHWPESLYPIILGNVFLARILCISLSSSVTDIQNGLLFHDYRVRWCIFQYSCNSDHSELYRIFLPS